MRYEVFCVAIAAWTTSEQGHYYFNGQLTSISN